MKVGQARNAFLETFTIKYLNCFINCNSFIAKFSINLMLVEQIDNLDSSHFRVYSVMLCFFFVVIRYLL